MLAGELPEVARAVLTEVRAGLLGARDPENGGFVMLGKTFKGLTDERLAWQTDLRGGPGNGFHGGLTDGGRGGGSRVRRLTSRGIHFC